MPANPLLQIALDLTEKILGVQYEVDFDDLDEGWSQVAIFYLKRSHETLKAVSIILSHGLVIPSEVLVRHLFELAVRLRFMEASPADRVPAFLRHSGLVDLGESDLNQLMLPKRPWGNLHCMCKELGLLDHYDTVYRLSSENAHGGGHGMAQDLLVASGQEQIPDWQSPGILHTALVYHVWVVEINLKVFPGLASSFPLNADWKDRMKVLAEDIQSLLEA